MSIILERKSQISIPVLKEQHGQFFQGPTIDTRDSLIEFVQLMQIYNGAMKTVSAKLEVLDDEFQVSYKHNPIHHLECRLKRPQSIYEKLQKIGRLLSVGEARQNILDIAGIRVICNFTDDIYTVEKLLLQHPDVTLINRKDYIEKPKENGYRSLHLVVQVPVFLTGRTEEVPVEIQLRTIAMDYWASLEHMLRYKNYDSETQKYAAMLLDCANTLAETERTMQYIRENIEDAGGTNNEFN